MGDLDLFLDNMLKATAYLADSLEKTDLDAVGTAIADRQRLIDAFPGDPSAVMLDENQQKILQQIRGLDAQLHVSAERYRTSLKDKLQTANKRSSGLFQYYKTDLNLSSGQVMDQKR